METKSKAVILINTAFYLFFFAVIYIFIKYLAVYILPFIISFSLVYILQKPAAFLEEKLKLRKSIVTLLSLLLIVAVICAVLCFGIKNLLSFFKDIENNNLLSSLSTMFNNFNQSMPTDIKNMLGISGDFFNEILKSISGYAMGIMATVLKRVPGIVFSVITSLVSACFLAFEYDSFVMFIKRQLSKNTVNKVARVKHIVNESLIGFFKGYLIIMLFTLLTMVIGLNVLGVKNAIAIAIIIAVVDILPVFGTGIILLPWAVVSLVMHNIFLGIGLVVLYVVYSVTRYFLEPRIIGKKVGVNPLISLFAMFLGLKLFGLFGLIFAPVTVSVLLVLQKNKIIKLWK